jgi:hypothetical protein
MPGKKALFEIGKNGSVEEFRAAYKKASDKLTLDGRRSKQIPLHKGAFAGFLEGNVGNLQEILCRPDDFEISGGRYGFTETPSRSDLVHDLTKKSDDPVAVIRLALGKGSPEARQRLLDLTLRGAVGDTYIGDNEFIAALVEAGARADAEINGSTGETLAIAITKSHTLDAIRVLVEKGGADFDEALRLINTDQRWDGRNDRANAVTKLEARREEICGPAAPAAAENATTDELLRTLIARVDYLTAEFEKSRQGQKADAPAETPGKKPGPDGYGHLRV